MTRVELILYGGGGVAIDTARYIGDVNKADPSQELVVTDVVDEGAGRIEDLRTLLGYAVVGHSSLQSIKNLNQKRFLVTLGHSPVRDEKFKLLRDAGHRFHTLVHPTAQISHTTSIGEGCIVAPFALIGTFATLQDNVIVNVRATIGHDTTLGESCIVSPHVCISGGVECGRSSFFGAATVIVPGVTIGQFVKLSAGTVVTGDIGSGCFAHGSPATARKLFDPATGRALFAGN